MALLCVPLAGEIHEWTNTRGQKIQAEFISATNEAVTISMQGKTFVVKLADLSPQSRALAAKLRVQKSKAREPQNDKTPLVKSPEVPKIDLDDNETRNRIIAEAIDLEKLMERGYEVGGEKLAYAANQETLYSGWIKAMHGNGQVRRLGQFKDGEWVSSTYYYSNGQKSSEYTHKDGKAMTVVRWKPNGEKCPVTNVVDGNGVVVIYDDDGTEGYRQTYKDGKIQ